MAPPIECDLGYRFRTLNPNPGCTGQNYGRARCLRRFSVQCSRQSRENGNCKNKTKKLKSTITELHRYWPHTISATTISATTLKTKLATGKGFRGFSLPDIFAPRSESSHSELSLPRTSSRELSLLGTFVPGSECSHSRGNSFCGAIILGSKLYE